MVSPSKKLQASAPFMVPETNANFPLVVVQPSGWETQTPGQDEDEQDEARTYETNVARAANHVSSPPRQFSVRDPPTQSSSPSSIVSPSLQSSSMATPLPVSTHSNGPKFFASTQGYRSILNGNIHRPSPTVHNAVAGAIAVRPTRGDDSIASSSASPVYVSPPRAIAPQSPAKATESRVEKRRLDEEEHEDEEAAEVEKAMVDEEGDGERHPESAGRTLRNHASNDGSDERASKRAKVYDLSSDDDEQEGEEKEEGSKPSLRTSPRKVTISTRKKSPPLVRRKSRPIPGEFVGTGRVVPIKERPFGEPTCHRCGNMKNKPACVLHSGEGRCDKCIVDAQGCWWRKGPGVYQSLSGTTPQKKLIDPRDEKDLKQTEEGKKKQAEKVTGSGKGVNNGKVQGINSDDISDSDSDAQKEDERRPLTRKSLRVAGAASKPANTSASANVLTTKKKGTGVISRTGGRKSSSAKTPSNPRGGNSRRDSRRSHRKRAKSSEEESESESESDDSRSDSSSESESSDSPSPPPKPLKGRAARKEDPNPNQQLQRYEKAEAKIRDELWALSWERERLLRTERRLQEELEDILAKKVQVRASH